MTIPSSHNTPSLRNTTLCSTQASCNFDEDTGSRHLEIGVGERQASSQLPKTAPCVQGWPRILQPYKFSYLFQKKSEKELVQQISTRKKITLPIFLRITTAVQECCLQISLFLFVLCVFFFVQMNLTTPALEEGEQRNKHASKEGTIPSHPMDLSQELSLDRWTPNDHLAWHSGMFCPDLWVKISTVTTLCYDNRRSSSAWLQVKIPKELSKIYCKIGSSC